MLQNPSPLWHVQTWLPPKLSSPSKSCSLHMCTHTYTSRHTVLLLGGGGRGGALQVLTLLHQNRRLAEITVPTGGTLSTEAEMQVNLLRDADRISRRAKSLLFQVVLCPQDGRHRREGKSCPERGGVVKTETLCPPRSQVQKQCCSGYGPWTVSHPSPTT